MVETVRAKESSRKGYTELLMHLIALAMRQLTGTSCRVSTHKQGVIKIGTSNSNPGSLTLCCTCLILTMKLCPDSNDFFYNEFRNPFCVYI